MLVPLKVFFGFSLGYQCSANNAFESRPFFVGILGDVDDISIDSVPVDVSFDLQW